MSLGPEPVSPEPVSPEPVSPKPVSGFEAFATFHRPPDALSPVESALEELAVVTRNLLAEIITSVADPSAIGRATASVADAVALLAGAEHRPPRNVAEEEMSPRTSQFTLRSPLVGRINPMSPPMHVVINGLGMDAEIVGRVTYPIQFEGPPGCVHGGFLAMAFDELLGYAQAESGNPGMTAHIEVDFRAPSPLGTELVYRARCDRVEGRKIHVSADLFHGDTLCAQARAIFISMRPEVFEQLMALREQRRSGT